MTWMILGSPILGNDTPQNPVDLLSPHLGVHT